MKRILQAAGAGLLKLCVITGRFFLFLGHAIRVMISTRLKVGKLITQMNAVGVNSFPITMLSSIGTGMVFALQAFIGFQRVGGEQYVGSVVALGMIRELGPVLTGLMVTGRVGSAITAEIGTMQITEQLDALTTLRINPFQYLVIPRILAAISMVPCLALFSMAFGIIGGYFTYVHVLGLNPEDYVSSIKNFVELGDIVSGILKSCFFGLILSWVGTYKGFNTHGGARGVGIATTESVVLSSTIILVGDYILTKLIEQL